MSNLDDTGLNLEQLFLPAWAQQSADVNKYADFAGYPDDDKYGGKGGERRRRESRGNRPFQGDNRGKGDRPFRNNERGGDRRGRPFRSPQRTNVNGTNAGTSPEGNRDHRLDRRKDRNDRNNRGGRRPERKPLPPLPEVDVQLIPESIVVETLARQIRQSGRAYPLFDIAHIILKKPERLEVAFSTIKKNGQVVQPLFFCTLDRTIWFSEDEAMEYVLKNHFGSFYETEKIPIDGPKGTYTFVAQCGMSGEILGPPNLHDYQNKICKIHAEKFPHVPFEVYKSRIRIVKDPEIIEKWKEQMSFTSQYKCLQVPEPLVLNDMASVREHFRQTHLASVIQKVDTVTLTNADIQKQPNHIVSVLYRRLLEEQRRFPLKLVTVLSQKFATHTLQFFKINKTITHVCISRPHYLDMENTSVSENVRNIMGYVTAHPGCKRADIYNALIPGYTEATANIAKETETLAAAKKKEATTPAAVPATAEDTQKAAETTTAPAAPVLPQEVASALANLNADLHWLIQCGHVIEFYKGNIEPAPKKNNPPVQKQKKKAEPKAETEKSKSKPKAKQEAKQEAKAETQTEATAAAPAAETPTEAKVEEPSSSTPAEPSAEAPAAAAPAETPAEAKKEEASTPTNPAESTETK